MLFKALKEKKFVEFLLFIKKNLQLLCKLIYFKFYIIFLMIKIILLKNSIRTIII
jgi:hypothetical protein